MISITGNFQVNGASRVYTDHKKPNIEKMWRIYALITLTAEHYVSLECTIVPRLILNLLWGPRSSDLQYQYDPSRGKRNDSQLRQNILHQIN